MAYLYRHIRLDKNQPFYIGIGSDADGKYTRAYNVFSRNNFWKNIINKTEYEVEILLDDISWEEAIEKEIEFIKLYGRTNLNTGTLCNLTNGGEGSLGAIVSEETKRKRSKTMKGVKKPLWAVENQSKRQKGIVCWNFVKAAQLRNTGSTQSKEAIEKRVKKLIGRKNTQEQIDKMRKSAIDMGKCRKVLCITNNVIYDSIAEASRILGVANIGYVCQGKLKQTKGYVFKYVDELENRIKQLEK